MVNTNCWEWPQFVETKINGTSYGMMELSKRQNNLKMEELAGLLGMLRPGSLVLLWCSFHLGDLMTHWPPPPGFGQDNSESLVSKTVRAKQTEGLAGPLFSLSPIWDTPLRLCHILPVAKLNGHRFFCLPFHSYPVMLSWESEAVRELLPGAFVFRSKMNGWIGEANILKKKSLGILSRSRPGSRCWIGAHHILSKVHNALSSLKNEILKFKCDPRLYRVLHWEGWWKVVHGRLS